MKHSTIASMIDSTISRKKKTDLKKPEITEMSKIS